MPLPRALPPLVRRQGKVAEQAGLRARADLARVLGDPREEHAASRALAEYLGRTDTELDLAVELALKALGTTADATLRERLIAWLVRLGEAGLAASELQKLAPDPDPARQGSRLLRVGVFHARAGDALGALEALAAAESLDSTSALAPELVGSLGTWATDLVPPEVAADAYLRAARTHEARGDEASAAEDYARAVVADPTHGPAVEALVARVPEGRPSVADALLRRHATALAERGLASAAKAVHERRRALALDAGDVPRALAALFDDEPAALVTSESASAFEAVLARASAHDLLAQRLELRAEKARGAEAARLWSELGRLAAGPLASLERAAEAHARSLAADATSKEQLATLEGVTRSIGRSTWLVEGLVRGARAIVTPETRSSVLAAARTLADLADGTREPLLASWARRVVVEHDPDDGGARASVMRDETAMRRRDEEVAETRRALEAATGRARVPLLAELARLLRSAPDRSELLANVLGELAEAGDDEVFWEAVRVADRIGDHGLVGRICRARLLRPGAPPRARITLVAALRRAGELAAASQEAKDLASACTSWAYAVMLTTALLSGDDVATGSALAALAPTLGARYVASLSAVAAGLLARGGDVAAARKAAEAASRADPDDASAAVVLADLVVADGGALARRATERVLELVGPDAKRAAFLAQAYQDAGEPRTGFAWAKRALSLSPGDGAAAEAVVRAALAAGDVAEAVTTLTWLLPQPLPARAMGERVARILELIAGKDLGEARGAARTALDVLGPKVPALRDVVTKIAETSGDAALRVVLAERWIATGVPAADRGARLLELAEICRRAGNTGGEVNAYARAARANADLSRVSARLAELDPATLDGDAELALLEARAEALLAEGRSERAMLAFRDLGAAAWDLADDRSRAVTWWMRAAQLDSVRGYGSLRRDLVEFTGVDYAVDYLAELASREPDRARAAMIATEAARAALDAGAHDRALLLARTALDRHAGHAEALAIAEQATQRLERVPEMSAIYDQVGRRALGRFGRRAAHHRAARFFAEGGVPMLALKHAAQAFVAVPSEGSTLELLERTADRANRRGVAVKTLEHVAELSRVQAVRAGWLLRGAELAGQDVEGMRQRVDLLLKALVLAPTPTVANRLGEAARLLLEASPEEREALAMRLERADASLGKALEGPDGARIAIAFASVALDPFEDGAWAWRAIERAMKVDADVDEYAPLARRALDLARAPDAKDGLDRLFAEMSKPFSNVGVALYRLAGAIAGALGDHERHAGALVRAVEKDDSDDAAVVEAEAALVGLDDAARAPLEARFTKHVSSERRFEALRAVAGKARERGDAATSLGLLLRARDLAPEEERAGFDAELSEALAASGRVDDALRLSLETAGVPAEVRAARWEQLGLARAGEGDAAGAAEAFDAAARLQPTPERWHLLEKAAEAANRGDLRREALAALVELLSGRERLAAQKRLARAEGARGALDVAEATWRAILEADPSDGEADVAIEALLAARADYAGLAQQLGRRAERLAEDPSSKETLRAVRLRRAAILEQRLERPADAARELERLLVESPAHASALRWLADLYDRLGQPARALPHLEVLAARAAQPAERKDAAVRRVRALLAMGDLERARDAARTLAAENPSSVSVLEIVVEVARARQDAGELGAALAALARVSPEDVRARSEMLVEAAQVAARAGDPEASLARAREAARLAPEVVSTQLFARGLEYRLRGAGSREDAATTRASLSSILRASTGAPLEPEDLALTAFLLAEAEDILEPGSGVRVLRQALDVVGTQPLVALGLAERAAARGDVAEATTFYADAAFGNLLGLRAPGRVALDAARVAVKAGDTAAATRFLDEAQLEPETRDEAHALAAAMKSAPAAPRRSLPPPLPSRASLTPSAPPMAAVPPPPSVPKPPDMTPGPPLVALLASPTADAAGVVAEARSRAARGDRDEAERRLEALVKEGSLDAADALDELLVGQPSRTAALVKVRRQAAELRPGDMKRLASLRDAARADQNPVYVRALEHVLHAFDGGPGIAPPPLVAQSTQPGMLSLLTRHSKEDVGQAFGVVWEGARPLFVKPPTAYGTGGHERVVPGPTSILSRLYEVALRLLDTPRFALFHHRTKDAPALTVALLDPPSAIITGDVKDDTADIRFTLGKALAAVLPENILLLGLPEREGAQLYRALVGAFGPSGATGIDRETAHIADTLWQSLPPRSQRRLQELLATAAGTSFELARTRATQSGLRVGFFLSGDFGFCAKAVVKELGGDPARLGTSGGLTELSTELAPLADLYRLAIRSEYADARWNVPAPSSVRIATVKGHFPV